MAVCVMNTGYFLFVSIMFARNFIAETREKAEITRWAGKKVLSSLESSKLTHNIKHEGWRKSFLTVRQSIDKKEEERRHMVKQLHMSHHDLVKYNIALANKMNKHKDRNEKYQVEAEKSLKRRKTMILEMDQHKTEAMKYEKMANHYKKAHVKEKKRTKSLTKSMTMKSMKSMTSAMKSKTKVTPTSGDANDWVATLDPASQRYYYTNKITYETTWEVPPELLQTLIKDAGNQEIESVRSHLRDKVNSVKKLQKVFKKLDLDNNGTLSKIEFGSLIHTVLGHAPSERELTATWRAASRMKQGDGGEATSLEVATLCGWTFPESIGKSEGKKSTRPVRPPKRKSMFGRKFTTAHIKKAVTIAAVEKTQEDAEEHRNIHAKQIDKRRRRSQDRLLQRRKTRNMKLPVAFTETGTKVDNKLALDAMLNGGEIKIEVDSNQKVEEPPSAPSSPKNGPMESPTYTGEDIKTWNFAKLNNQGKGSTKEMDTLAVAIQTKTTAKETKTAKEKIPETKITAKQTAKKVPETKEEIDTIRKQIRVKIKDNRAAL